MRLPAHLLQRARLYSTRKHALRAPSGPMEWIGIAEALLRARADAADRLAAEQAEAEAAAAPRAGGARPAPPTPDVDAETARAEAARAAARHAAAAEEERQLRLPLALASAAAAALGAAARADAEWLEAHFAGFRDCHNPCVRTLRADLPWSPFAAEAPAADWPRLPPAGARGARAAGHALRVRGALQGQGARVEPHAPPAPQPLPLKMKPWSEL